MAAGQFGFGVDGQQIDQTSSATYMWALILGALQNISVPAPVGGATSAKQDTQIAAEQAIETAVQGTLKTSDSGLTQTTVRGVAGVPFTSADQSGSTASVTDAPTSGQKLVITDLILSSDTALSLSFSIESSATVIYGPIYLAAGSSTVLVTRGKFKLGTADKKLQVKASVAGNISVLALYYSEA